MAKLIALALLITTCFAQAQTLEKVGQSEISSSTKFDKIRFGGISSLAYDENEKVLWAVSDDRGKFGAPRVYKLKLVVTNHNGKPDFQVSYDSTYPIHEVHKALPVFDFEGLAILPWGDLLLSSEGDEGSRPRRPPRLIDVKLVDDKAEGAKPKKPFAKWMRDFDLPPWYLPEKTGKATQGLRTNLGFEGLTMASDNKTVTAAAESRLYQDPEGLSRILQYETSGAWVITPQREWTYPLDENKNGIWLLRGISEIIQFEDQKYWVLERGLQVSGGPLLSSQLYEVELAGGAPLTKAASKAKDLPLLKKRLVFDLDQLGMSENFEALAWGPLLSDGRRLLIVANDNNFEKSPSYFVFLAVGVSRSSKGQERETNHSMESH